MASRSTIYNRIGSPLLDRSGVFYPQPISVGTSIGVSGNVTPVPEAAATFGRTTLGSSGYVSSFVSDGNRYVGDYTGGNQYVAGTIPGNRQSFFSPIRDYQARNTLNSASSRGLLAFGSGTSFSPSTAGSAASAPIRTSSGRVALKNPSSLIAFNGPFLSSGANYSGIPVARTLRQQASGYQDNWPDLYSQFVGGGITASQLFTRALDVESRFDRDRINSTNFNVSAPKVIKFNFGRTGGSITGTGVSFGY